MEYFNPSQSKPKTMQQLREKVKKQHKTQRSELNYGHLPSTLPTSVWTLVRQLLSLSIQYCCGALAARTSCRQCTTATGVSATPLASKRMGSEHVEKILDVILQLRRFLVMQWLKHTPCNFNSLSLNPCHILFLSHTCVLVKKHHKMPIC